MEMRVSVEPDAEKEGDIINPRKLGFPVCGMMNGRKVKKKKKKKKRGKAGRCRGREGRGRVFCGRVLRREREREKKEEVFKDNKVE